MVRCSGAPSLGAAECIICPEAVSAAANPSRTAGLSSARKIVKLSVRFGFAASAGGIRALPASPAEAGKRFQFSSIGHTTYRTKRQIQECLAQLERAAVDEVGFMFSLDGDRELLRQVRRHNCTDSP